MSRDLATRESRDDRKMVGSAERARPTYTLRTLAVAFILIGIALAVSGYWYRTRTAALTITADPGTEIFIGPTSLGTVPVYLSAAQLKSFAPNYEPGSPMDETTFEVHPLGRILGRRSGETVWCKVPADRAGRFYVCETPWGNGVPSAGSGVGNGIMTLYPHVRQHEQDRHARTFTLAKNEVKPSDECEVRVEVMQTEGLEHYAEKDGSNVHIRVYKVGERKYTIHEMLLTRTDPANELQPPHMHIARFPAPVQSGDYCVTLAVASTNPKSGFKWAFCHDIRRLTVFEAKTK